MLFIFFHLQSVFEASFLRGQNCLNCLLFTLIFLGLLGVCQTQFWDFLAISSLYSEFLKRVDLENIDYILVFPEHVILFFLLEMTILLLETEALASLQIDFVTITFPTLLVET